MPVEPITPSIESQSYLRVVLADTAVFVRGNDILGEETPSCHCRLAVLASDFQRRLSGLVLQVLAIVDIQHSDRTQETHTLLRHSQQLASIWGESDPLHGGGEVPNLHAITSLDVP